MKPCRKNLKRIASLALGDLAADAARELRQHLEQCPGCRRYFQEMSGVTRVLADDAASTPEVETRGSFHTDLLRRLEGPRKQSLWGRAQTSGPGWLGSRVLAWSAAVVLVLAVLVWRWSSRPIDSAQPVARNVPASASPAPQISADNIPEPTEANYMAAANRSLDELSKLLERESRRSTTAAAEPVYTVFSMPPEDLR
jgi:anti-sigma factor RsiW